MIAFLNTVRKAISERVTSADDLSDDHIRVTPKRGRKDGENLRD